MKKIPPRYDFFSMDTLLRRLTPEQFAQLDHEFDVRIRRIKMRLKSQELNAKRWKREVPKHNPMDEVIAELYALKSFQAQDMSGRFNRARMNQAIKEAKPKSGRRLSRD